MMVAAIIAVTLIGVLVFVVWASRRAERSGGDKVTVDEQAEILGKVGAAQEVEREIESDRAVTPSDRLSRDWSRD